MSEIIPDCDNYQFKIDFIYYRRSLILTTRDMGAILGWETHES